MQLFSSFTFQVSYFNVYLLLSVFCIILSLVATPSALIAGSNSRKRLHEQLVESVMNNSLHFFQFTPFGRIIGRFSYDISIIDKVGLDFASFLCFIVTETKLTTPIKHIKVSFSFWPHKIYSNMNLSFQKIAMTSQRLLQFILLCLCAILINGLINFYFILLTVPMLAIYYFVQKFYRKSTR